MNLRWEYTREHSWDARLQTLWLQVRKDFDNSTEDVIRYKVTVTNGGHTSERKESTGLSTEQYAKYVAIKMAQDMLIELFSDLATLRAEMKIEERIRTLKLE